jgi:hypothetical protein
VPLGGIAHLGATFNHLDTQDALQWLHFDAYIMEALESATHAGITDTLPTHGVQYLSLCDTTPSAKTKDYVKIPFDTGVQGQFSEGVQHLQQTLWQIDKLVVKLAAWEKNSLWIRSALRIDAFNILNGSLAKEEDPLHGPWFEKTTPEGVFIANETGIVRTHSTDQAVE